MTDHMVMWAFATLQRQFKLLLGPPWRSWLGSCYQSILCNNLTMLNEEEFEGALGGLLQRRFPLCNCYMCVNFESKRKNMINGDLSLYLIWIWLPGVPLVQISGRILSRLPTEGAIPSNHPASPRSPDSTANHRSWASYQICKIVGCASAGNAGNVLPRHRLQRKPLVSDPDMHHGTCVTHVPCCMSGSFTRGGGENVPGIPGACANLIFYVSVKRLMIDVVYPMVA